MMKLVPRAKHVAIAGGHISTFIFAPLMACWISQTLSVLEKEIKSKAQSEAFLIAPSKL